MSTSQGSFRVAVCKRQAAVSALCLGLWRCLRFCLVLWCPASTCHMAALESCLAGTYVLPGQSDWCCYHAICLLHQVFPNIWGRIYLQTIHSTAQSIGLVSSVWLVAFRGTGLLSHWVLGVTVQKLGCLTTSYIMAPHHNGCLAPERQCLNYWSRMMTVKSWMRTTRKHAYTHIYNTVKHLYIYILYVYMYIWLNIIYIYIYIYIYSFCTHAH